jgi:hypothetical protein
MKISATEIACNVALGVVAVSTFAKKIAANVVKIKVCVKCLSFPLPQTFQINKYFAFWQKLKIIINDIKIKKLFKNIY